MKHKKERMYMTYVIQQRPQQISTENLAYQKRKSVADNFSRCEASSFFFPLFVLLLNGFNKINGGIYFRHHDHNTGWCAGSNNNVWGVASGTKIRIIRICGAKSAATPPHQNRNAE